MHDHLASFRNRTVAHILFIDLAFYTEISRCKNSQEGIVGAVTGVSAGAAVIVVDWFYDTGDFTDHGRIGDVIV